MDYRGLFEDAVDALRKEKRYRVFADLERIAGRFPAAAYRDASDNAREIPRTIPSFLEMQGDAMSSYFSSSLGK